MSTSETFRWSLLVVEDDAAARAAMAALLEADGHLVTQAGSAEEALKILRRASFHLALIDHQLPGRNGTELVAEIAEACPMTGLVLVTGFGSVPSAVRAMKLGALDYVAKPVDASKLRTVVRAALAGRPRWVPNHLLEAGEGPFELDGMIATSRAMRSVFERIHLAASTDTTVLIHGESGTGKDLVARAIHQHGARAKGPFVAVNMGAIPPELVSSELFGHEKGAFTGATHAKEGKFELAEKGTIFLDEIDTMDDRTQVALLRVLESFRSTRVGGKKDRVVDVRVLAATNADLARKVRSGEFRQDLYYRLAIFSIEIAPLRERREDIAPLAAMFLERFAKRYGRVVPLLPDETLAALARHDWPGNVRELRNVIDQAAILCQGKALAPELLPKMLQPAGGPTDFLRIPLHTPLKEIERQVIVSTLRATGGNKNRTARVLGISRRALYNKLARYGMQAPEAVPAVDGASLGG